MECVANGTQVPVAPRETSKRRVADEDVAGTDTAYGQTLITSELLRAAGKVTGHMKGDPVGGLMTYFGENSLIVVDDVVVHYAAAAERVSEAICDAPMAFSNLASTLCRLASLQREISSLDSQLFEQVPGARQEEVTTKTHPELLELLRLVCAQYEKEEPLRNSSKYDLARQILEADGETSKDDLSRLTARGDVYAKTRVCDTCVPLRELNEKVLGKDFDSKLHLAPEAIDFSGDGFTCQLAATPGPESRLALTKMAQVQLGVLSDLKLDSTLRRRRGGAAGTPSRRDASTRSVPHRSLRFSTLFSRCCGSVIVGRPWPRSCTTSSPAVFSMLLDPGFSYPWRRASSVQPLVL